jgi:glycosyltransferase involved in cell wall biosynthesis
MVAPLFESVPPKLYGGTERVVSHLTEELVRLGHDVTLFASGDSTTRARLVPGCHAALRLSHRTESEAEIHATMLRHVHAQRQNFDLVHLHIDDWPRREPALLEVPHVTTLHGRLDTPDTMALFESHPELPLISISDAQRAPLPRANWLGTVHHGVPLDSYVPRFDGGEYLAFLGRISREKRIDRAIELARRFAMPLRVAAKVDAADRPYYEAIRNDLQSSWVEFVGEVDEARKNEFLSHAYALLFPIDWPEPFGLAMIEAMSCGTPVIAWRGGSTPEIVDDGLTGYLVDSVEGALAALERVTVMDRRRVARIARQRFTARRMALDYLQLYERQVQSLRTSSRRHGAGGSTHAGPRE